MDTPVKLNIGAGTIRIDGFTPIDKSLGHDARKLGYDDNSVDEIRASHILEHFGWRELHAVLKEWVRVLKPGGLIRLAVPDADKCLTLKDDPKRLFYMMGGQTDENDFHKSAFDEPILRQLMTECGISDVRRWESKNTDCACMPISLNLEGIKGEAKPEKKTLKIVGAMSIPRVGWNDNWGCCLQSCGVYGIPIKRFSGAFWGQCMQRVFEEIVNEGADWVLTIDYDSMFSPNHLKQMFSYVASRPDIDALCPLQCKRGADSALAYMGGKTEHVWTGQPLKCETGHFGLTLLKVEKIRSLPKPWFWSKPAPDGGWGEGRVDDDIWFWNQWKEAGNTVYVAPDIRIGHLELLCSEFEEVDVDGHLEMKAVRKHVGEWWNGNGGKSSKW